MAPALGETSRWTGRLNRCNGVRNLRMPDLHAYMKSENYVTRFSFPYSKMPVVARDFDLRDNTEDKLPYIRKTLERQVQARHLEISRAKCARTAAAKSARTATEIPRGDELETNVNAQQASIFGIVLHADHFPSRSPLARHRPTTRRNSPRRAELLVATRRHRRRMARATVLPAVRLAEVSERLRETQPGPASTDERAAGAPTSVL